MAQYEYSRPELLGSLSAHAVEAISSSAQRIVVCPTRPASLPWATGYAEVRTRWEGEFHLPTILTCRLLMLVRVALVRTRQCAGRWTWARG